MERSPADDFEDEFVENWSEKSERALLAYLKKIPKKDILKTAYRRIPGLPPKDPSSKLLAELLDELEDSVDGCIKNHLKNLKEQAIFFKKTEEEILKLWKWAGRMKEGDVLLEEKDIERVNKITTAVFSRYFPIIRYITDKREYFNVFTLRIAFLIAKTRGTTEGMCLLWQDCEKCILDNIKQDIKKDFNREVDIPKRYRWWHKKPARNIDMGVLLKILQGDKKIQDALQKIQKPAKEKK